MPAYLSPVEFKKAKSQAIAYDKAKGTQYAIGFIQGLSFMNVLDAKQKQELVYAVA